jgi:hypothetical protein
VSDSLQERIPEHRKSFPANGASYSTGRALA